ncbi:MAG: hypothetical protein JSU72_15290 [Deltaproteobacteria bacterium]|nr:MAG: hypothetical protein JSU72_15290 [Deltaproteobacteria bacterium]
MILNIVCPFCERKHPIPTDFDWVYTCDCGGCYRVCNGKLLEDGMNLITKEVWDSDFLPLPEEDEFGFCKVVVNREFDKFISLKQSMDDLSEIRFCKYDPSAELALVWMKRPY